MHADKRNVVGESIYVTVNTLYKPTQRLCTTTGQVVIRIECLKIESTTTYRAFTSRAHSAVAAFVFPKLTDELVALRSQLTGWHSKTVGQTDGETDGESESKSASCRMCVCVCVAW